MFSRWGAFVYRFRRPVALFAVIIAIASGVLATQTSSALSAGGWLDADSESAEVSARLDTEFGAGKSSIIALFRSATPGADATSAEFQGAIATATAGLASTPHVSGIIGYAETGDPRFISTAGDAAYIVIELDVTDEESVEVVDDIRAAIVAPAGYSYQLTGYGPITKDSAEQSEKDLQKAELVSLPIVALILVARLRIDRRRRDAAACCRPGDPDQPRDHLRRRPAGRDEHLRAQHRDDARSRPRDRLLAVHRQPIPRRAAARSNGRRGGRTDRGHGRQGRCLQRHRGRHRAVRTAPVRGPGDPLDRHRGGDRHALLGRLRAGLPAGRARDARASGQRVVAERAAPSHPADRRRCRAGEERALGTRRARRHAAADRGAHPDTRVPAHPRSPVPAPGAGRPGRRDLPARRREPRRIRRAADRVRAGRDDPDHHPRRRPGLADRPRQHPGDRRLRGERRRTRGDRPGREPVRHP